MIESYGILLVQFTATPGFPPDNRVCCEGVCEESVLATRDVRLTGLYEDMHPGRFSAFLRGKMMAGLGRLPGGEAEVENA